MIRKLTGPPFMLSKFSNSKSKKKLSFPGCRLFSDLNPSQFPNPVQTNSCFSLQMKYLKSPRFPSANQHSSATTDNGGIGDIMWVLVPNGWGSSQILVRFPNQLAFGSWFWEWTPKKQGFQLWGSFSQPTNFLMAKAWYIWNKSCVNWRFWPLQKKLFHALAHSSLLSPFRPFGHLSVDLDLL